MLSAYTVPHRYSNRRNQRVPIQDTTVDSPLYQRKSIYHVCDRLEIDTEEERSIYETGQFTFLQESDGRNGSIYYPSSLPSFRVPPVDKKKRKKKNRDERMASPLLRSVNQPHRKHISELLDKNERILIEELLGENTEVLASGIAQLLWSIDERWEEKSRGVVCYAKDFDAKTKSIVIVDPSSNNPRIVDAYKWHSISHLSMDSHKYLITFEVEGETVMGLNFHSPLEASHFYRVLLEAQQKSDVRRSMRGSQRPKAQPSKVSPLSQQSNSSRDSGIIVDDPPKMTGQPKKKKESKSIISLFFGEKSDKKKKKKDKGDSTLHVPSSSSTSVQWNGKERKIDWKSDEASSSQSLPPIEFKKGAAFTDMWNERDKAVPVSELSPRHLWIVRDQQSEDPTQADWESPDTAPSSLLLTTRSGSLENAVIRNSIRVAKHTTPTGKRATPKEIKMASDAKRADRHWDSSMVGSALPSPLPSIDTSPHQARLYRTSTELPTFRGPLPCAPRSRSPTPPLLPRHRSINNNHESTVLQSTTIYRQSSSSPLSPPPAYPPPPPPPSEVSLRVPETTVINHRSNTVDEAPPPPAPHRTAPPPPVNTVPASRLNGTVSPPPPPPSSIPPPPIAPSTSIPPPPPLPSIATSPPPSIANSTVSPPPPPPPTTTTVSTTVRNGAPSNSDLLSQIRGVNKDNLLKSVDRIDRSPTTSNSGGGIMESLQKEIEKRRTVMNESSDDEESTESDDSDWSE
ncbi:hypothetical protein PRIPAC_92521 [Pristionchus pacificus]|uniref:WH1 domain-containing protein n=1 Tax=Pristionchus pacificus TaxID=54126 RepID=A0A2A6BJB8_PRIPA|nr:hypothetical protein PRIPAC_92521 [Pristionchus pacificus]|eukprot:PDM65928.1 hypothetical protein PRIPAC_44207 [Pristionchus pacificus]